ncbi:MAG TPA: MMPL family transporter, partial [Solirubrobacteraceae bacterium]|nr:MMPL family transporter [Solirubrobacteraceae bacterium]
MNASQILSALAGGAARRPRLVIAMAIVLALAGAALALRLRPTAATSTFVSSSSSQYEATQRFYRNFGEEPIEVLVKGDLQQLVLSEDIDRLVGLEGCLSGNVPASALAREGGPNGPCGQLARAHTIKVVFGPGTFINEAASQIDEQLASQTKQAQTQAKQAERVVRRQALRRGLSESEAQTLGREAAKITTARFQEGLVTLALQYGLTSRPSLDDHDFVTSLVFDSTKPAGTPKQRFAYLFPSRDAALVSVRMRAGLSESQRTHTIDLIRKAVDMPQWRPTRGGSYLVTGEPVIVADLTHSITDSLELLLVAVLLVMAATLGLVFTGRPRLLPLAIALLAAALTFGALSLAGASLTMATIAVLPVLVGLAVDYAIQFQSRVREEAELGGPPEARIRRAAALGAPTIATAGAASAAAMLVLVLSPVPMVRGFGLLLVVGVVVAFLCALTAGAAVLSSTASGARPGRGFDGARARVRRPRRASPRARSSGAWRATSAAWRGAGELLRENPLTRAISRAALVGSVRRPGRVLCVGLALAALGWGLDTQTKVQTDITKLVPQNLASLEGLDAVERTTGVGGEIDLMVSSKSLTKPSTIEWMSSYESAVLKRFGYSAARGCGRARLCPAFSLPDLFAQQTAAAPANGKGAAKRKRLTQAQVDGLLSAIPPYFAQDVLTNDRRVATLAFGIRLMSLARQQQLIEQMRASLHPPAGVSAQLVGLPVLAAKSAAEVASPLRRVQTLLASLAVVALVLLAAFRGDVRRALAPLVPIALASGWSALILFAVRVPLNPMSVTLGALVIAISTEFSVLLAERHRQERLAGHAWIDALRRAYGRTGAAVAASGATAIAGFGVLALSNISMLRDFGLVTLIDLSVSLLGVLVALPAALAIFGAPAEHGAPGEPVKPRGEAREPVHE